MTEFNPDDLHPVLRLQPRSRQADHADRILDGVRAGRFPLPEADRRELRAFIASVRQSRAVTDDTLRAVNLIVRHYEQHVVARARR